MEQRLTDTMGFIVHKGRKILFADYSGLRREKLAETIVANVRAAAPSVEGHDQDMLALLVFKDCFFDERAFKALSLATKAMNRFYAAVALVGLTTMQLHGVQMAAALAGTNMEIKDLKTTDEAKEWLIQRN